MASIAASVHHLREHHPDILSGSRGRLFYPPSVVQTEQGRRGCSPSGGADCRCCIGQEFHAASGVKQRDRVQQADTSLLHQIIYINSNIISSSPMLRYCSSAIFRMNPRLFSSRMSRAAVSPACANSHSRSLLRVGILLLLRMV